MKCVCLRAFKIISFSIFIHKYHCVQLRFFHSFLFEFVRSQPAHHPINYLQNFIRHVINLLVNLSHIQMRNKTKQCKAQRNQIDFILLPLLLLTLALSHDYDFVIRSDEIISHQHLSTFSFDIFIWLQCMVAFYIQIYTTHMPTR